MKTDIIQERSVKGDCPICNKKLTSNFKAVIYKNRKIWIHNKHISAGGKNV